MRLLIGHADQPEGVAAELVVLSQLTLVTAAYGAALAIVQRDLRSLIGTLAMSQSALVLGGLAGTLPMELNGAFCVWISSGLALTGIGLVSWALESRAGPIRLDSPQGRFWDASELAVFFLLFGLARPTRAGTRSGHGATAWHARPDGRRPRIPWPRGDLWFAGFAARTLNGGSATSRQRSQPKISEIVAWQRKK